MESEKKQRQYCFIHQTLTPFLFGQIKPNLSFSYISQIQTVITASANKLTCGLVKQPPSTSQIFLVELYDFLSFIYILTRFNIAESASRNSSCRPRGVSPAMGTRCYKMSSTSKRYLHVLSYFQWQWRILSLHFVFTNVSNFFDIIFAPVKCILNFQITGILFCSAITNSDTSN